MDDAAEPARGLADLLRIPYQALTTRVLADLNAAGFADLRAAHLTVFKYLDPDGSRLTDLTAHAQMTKQSMAALIADLERWGYLDRAPDPADGRARIVRHSERGWSAARTARASIHAFESEWERQIGPDRMRQFRAVLEEFAAVHPPAPRRPPDRGSRRAQPLQR
ncbi:MAG: MarR family winged helix-turn-helix transcriptional regulator [Thermomicrobiales bacterium]